MYNRRDDSYWNLYEHRDPWKCPSCEIDNRGDRDDCRICMCPRDNVCRFCKKPNENIARYCRFCGKSTMFSAYDVFDPEARKERIKSARATDRKYRKRGHYFQWEDGPYQGLEDDYL